MKTRHLLPLLLAALLISGGTGPWCAAQEVSVDIEPTVEGEGEIDQRRDALEQQQKALDEQRRALDEQRQAIEQQQQMLKIDVVKIRNAAEKAARAQKAKITELMHLDRFAVHDPRSSELESQIRQATDGIRNAADDAARSAATSKLRAALDEYFEEDMKFRSEELDRVAARLAKLQQQLDRRRTKKAEIIDLQVKLAENDADGMGLFNQRRPNTFEIRVPVPIEMPPPPPGPFPFGQSPEGDLFGPATPSSDAAPAPVAAPVKAAGAVE